MRIARQLQKLPKHVWLLLAVYCCASLIHFAHNAEYIAFYPNMPLWITRENVYWVWLAITAVGIAGMIALSLGWRTGAALLFVAYGGFGLDGLGHYALALCSQHTLAMNFTIWFEVLAGSTLAVCAAIYLHKIIAEQRRYRRA